MKKKLKCLCTVAWRGLFSDLHSFWRDATRGALMRDGETGDQITAFSGCARILGPLGIITPGIPQPHYYAWKIGRIGWLTKDIHSAYRATSSDSLMRWIVEKRFLSPFRDIFAATSSVMGSSNNRLHEPADGGQLRCGSLSAENLDSICARSGDPLSSTCTVNPAQSLSSSSVIGSGSSSFPENSIYSYDGQK
jgi:hypothetical protein